MADSTLAEREWQKILIEGLVQARWTINHTRKARTAKGAWITPTTSKGFPDLVAVRAGRLLAVEVKGPRTTLDAEQVAWLALFAELPAANAWVLRPQDDWNRVGAWITDPTTAPKVHGFDPARLPSPPAVFLRRAEEQRRAARSRRGSRGVTLATPPIPEQGQML